MLGPIATLQTRCPNLSVLLEGYFQRMASLPQASQQQFWLYRAGRHLAHDPEHWIGAVVSNLDRIAGDVSRHAENAAELKRRLETCLPTRASQYRATYDDQILDTFTEMLGYQYLALRGYVDVRFIQAGADKAPDLEARSRYGRKDAVMECKNTHTSDEDRKYFVGCQGQVRNVFFGLLSSDPSLNPLLRKLLDKAEQAAAQLAAYHAKTWRRVVFMNFSPDVDAWLVEQELPTDMGTIWRTVAKALRQEQVELVVLERYGLGPIRQYTADGTDRQAAVERLVEVDIDLGGKEPREVILEAYTEAIERSLRAGDAVQP